MKLIIIRHGDPDYANDTLTERGVREAEILARRVRKMKPDFVYCSPLGRAQKTCLASQKTCGFTYETLDWLREFPGTVPDPETGKSRNPWDLMPSYMQANPILYGTDWPEADLFQGTDVQEKFELVKTGLDALLTAHGYRREGGIYKVLRPNTDTVVLFCHFGILAVMLAHLCSCSPYPFWQHFCALTTSVTTLATEEREKGIASFRCIGFGDLSHLYAADTEPSFSARFCEIYDSDDRH